MTRFLKATVLGIGVLLCIAFGVLYNYELGGPDISFCRNIKMFPSYARILAFDGRFTRYADKYSLYLYREQGKDVKPTKENGYMLEGIPVLFIPGNAGSYRQARSIASKTTNLIHDRLHQQSNSEIQSKKLDFFTADFNEDFTAFHGKTMLEQAEYLNDAIKFILNLYTTEVSPEIPIPTSVIVVGHSMGGIVSRIMLTLPNYNEGSIKTIFTLSSPHFRSPLTFDRDVMKIYRAVNEFWHQGYFGNSDDGFGKIAQDRLKDLSIVSITGGLLDTVLPADYTTLKGVVPYTNGFTVFTSGIPGVWSSIDHLAIVWCDQLRTVILNSLVDIIDYTSPDRLVLLSRRMSIFNNYYRPVVGELLDYSDNFNVSKLKSTPIDRSKVQFVNGYFKDAGDDKKTTVFVVPQEKKPYRFQVLGESNNLAIRLCNDNGNEVEVMKRDTTSDFDCLDVGDLITMVPKFQGVKSIKESTLGDRVSPNYGAILNLSRLNGYKYVMVEGSRFSGDLSVDSEQQMGISKIFSNHNTLETFNLVYRVLLVGIRSSLLAYRVKLSGTGDLLVKQVINEEIKWHIDNEFILDYHGDSPYMPLNHEDLVLEIWKDINEMDTSERIGITVKVDFLISMKLMIIRYRLTLISYGLIISLIVLIFQLWEHTKAINNNSGNNVSAATNNPKISSFDKVMNKFFNLKCISIVIAMSTVIGILNKLYLFRYLVSIINLEMGNHETNSLGIGQFQIVNGMFLILSVTFNYGLIYLVQGYLGIIRKLESNKRMQKIQYHCKTQINNKLKLCILAVLCVLTISVIPYQVIYVILVLIQLIRLPRIVKSTDFNSQLNVTMLMIMIWILPINIPIIIVLIHNLAINWKFQFSSHHNLLSILPIFYQVYFNNQTQLVNQICYGYSLYWLMAYVGYFINYCFFYGSINTFWLYHLFNYLCIGMTLISYIGESDQLK